MRFHRRIAATTSARIDIEADCPPHASTDFQQED